jgi:hypothetical protein
MGRLRKQAAAADVDATCVAAVTVGKSEDATTGLQFERRQERCCSGELPNA